MQQIWTVLHYVGLITSDCGQMQVSEHTGLFIKTYARIGMEAGSVKTRHGDAAGVQQQDRQVVAVGPG